MTTHRLALLLLILLPAQPAAACGGFFCSRTPVVQAREVVVYGYEEDGSLTMAVQIAYEGRDEDLAWILPLPAPPDEIATGTDALFTALQEQTEPVLNLDYRVSGECAPLRCSYPYRGGGGCCSERGATPILPLPPPSGDSDGGLAPPERGVTVHSMSVVGPYETVVLSATTAAEVLEWLGEHGYDIPESSEPLLAPYADAGFVFVALRMAANRDNSVIRPIVMRIPGVEACLPIRLTAIASTPDLPIVLFFLADAQAHAVNYSFVDPSGDPDLWTGALRWDDAVSQYVRELGGQAFSTDYADLTPEITLLELRSVLDLADAPPEELFRGLFERGYRGSPLLLAIFERHVVPPAGVDLSTYVNCLALSGSGCGVPLRYDPAALVRAIDEQVTRPRAAAQALVTRHPYTTRLSTSMRPEDMTIDPVFALDRGLPDVPRVRRATLWTRCSDEYFTPWAPRELEVGGELYRVEEGEHLTALDACRRMGGELGTPAGGGACTSAVGGRAPLAGLLALLGLVGFRVVRRR